MGYDRPEWHNSSEVNAAVCDFYHRHAKQPDSSEAKQWLLSYLDTIRSHLKAQGVPCQRFEFVGSTYEGLKVNDGLEFDIFVILDDRVFEVHSTHLPDYNRLRPKPNVQREYFRHALDNGFVSAEKMVRKFQSYMDTLKNTFPKVEREVVFRKHGPAIQMDVYRPYTGDFWFSVDLVPTIAILDNYYVAKPHTNMREAWLHSFSVETKNQLGSIDRDNGRRKQVHRDNGRRKQVHRDNGRRKQVLRTLKALCHREPTLARLSSHHLKMLLFSDLDENPSKTWRPDQLGIRLLDLIERLRRYLDNGHYPHYYLPEVNMIERFGGSHCGNMARRLEQLYNNETAFLKAFEERFDVNEAIVLEAMAVWREIDRRSGVSCMFCCIKWIFILVCCFGLSFCCFSLFVAVYSIFGLFSAKYSKSLAPAI